ncbi:endolytic transglycosylase MltG [Kutzneria sp. CA-103260]|uniref:endolytic transglycosylase MltG n=1 Tax=Kutzneria sp. CA-103260 TaxID=2802641 RepID=UPI001BA67BC5|nr:endolytic transglycosylase MltG [Kutzneria sp. CA-103260]QUQ66806.1 aminodeoxychorismate lyase-like protein [Kutzneria sp. CA-103260]
MNDVNDDVDRSGAERYEHEVDEHAADEFEGDDLDLFESGEETAGKKRKPRRRTVLLAVLLVVVIVGGWGAYYGAGVILGIGGYGNYGGDGDTDVLVQVDNGATTRDIAEKLQSQDVVRTVRAFLNASAGNTDVANVQPGFYVMKTHMSGEAAVTRLVAPTSRVGNVQIKAGEQLDDTKNPDNSVKPGILSEIATASCVTLNGAKKCVSADDMHKAAETADPAKLGIPDWAEPIVAKADPKHRLEGLIVSGVYDVKPGTDADTTLKSVLLQSAAKLNTLPQTSQDTGLSPYQVLTVASLIEREAITSDFTKVSRVIYNRLARGIPMGDDSTINYVLDQPLITTSDADRGKPGAYNTYLNTGLTPTPISSPSQEALTAAQKPADGPWLFFVKCDKSGNSCFAVTQAEQDANTDKARAAGAF